MALPISTNTTCDIYRALNMPPADPDVAGVPCFLKGDWRGGHEAGERNNNTNTWTHVMLIDVGVDIRDSYTGANSQTAQDAVYIPDKDGTRFHVIFIERVQRGTAHEHKRVYLDRNVATWPTNDL